MAPPDVEKRSGHSGSSRPWYLNRWLLGAVAAVAAYAAAGFLLAPYLVRHFVPKVAAEQFKRQASVGEVRVNPFLLTFEAKDFAFQEAGGEPILGIKRLFVDFEVESLFRWAWTFADLRIEGPSLNLVVDKDDRLNLARIVDDLPKSEPPPEPGPPPRLLLKRAALAGGSVTFSDRSNPTPATATVAPLDLELNDISTLPEHRGPYGITATLPGGGTVSWQGEVSLNPIVSSGTVRIGALRPATGWRFIQDQLRLAEPGGEIDLDAAYRFAYAAGKTTLTVDPIKLSAKGLALTEKGASSPILELAAVEIPAARFDLGARELTVPALAVRDGRVAATVDADGTINWATLAGAAPAAPEAKAVTTAAPAQPWKVRVESLTVDGVALDYSDASRATPIAIKAGSTRLSLTAEAEAGGADLKLVADNIEVALQGLNLSEATGAPLLALDSVSLQGGRFDLAERDVRLQRLAIGGGNIQVVRKADGTIRQVAALQAGEEGKIRRELREAREAARVEGRPWSFALDRLELTGTAIGYADEITRPAIQYDLEGVNVVVKDIRNDGKTPLAYEAQVNLRQGGSASVSGTLAPAGDAAEAQVKLAGISLKPLAPLVSKFAAVRLESGQLSGATRVAYQQKKGGPSLKASGAVSVGGLLLKEAASGERLLAWKSLAANGVDFSLAPDRLTIKDVRLVEPGAKIVIFKDKSVNLAQALKTGETAAAAAPAKALVAAPKPQKEPAATASAAKPFPVTVERVRLEKGVVDFADLSLVLPFAARIEDFNGVATGLSSNPASRASLKFEGQVGEFGQANVDGSLAPFAPKTFTDITVAFRNVAMTPLSPYSATFAGRKIATGKLNLDLQYKIENSELLGDNKVVLQDFTLGERVESPGALSLPLDLAIAILTDSEGRIDVAVPVRGNVDSPEFSYGHVIWQAIVNVITKIVTAPFRALGALFGGGEGLEAVLFEPGRGELAPPEREKLKKVAEALAKRPQLKLTAHGAFDPAADGKAIKDRNLRLDLAKKLDQKVAPGEDPGPVAYDNAKTQRALEQIAAERGGKNAVDAFQAAYEKSAGKKAKRVNPVLALIGQESEDREFYRALFAHLVESAPKPDAELQALGERRAAAIVQELTTKAGVDAARVAPGKVEPAEAKDKTVPVKLELGVAGGAA